MKLKHLFIAFVFLPLLNREEEKKTENVVEEKVETTVETDSVNEEEIVSEKETVVEKIPAKENTKKDDIVEKEAKSLPPKPRGNEILITPIQHATMVIETANMTIYIDPIGGKETFSGQRPPDFILITDIHGDHLNVETLSAIAGPKTTIIGPRAVKERMPDNLLKNYSTIFNGLSRNYNTSSINLGVEGVAMYNLRKEALQFHEKGRGNGYILTLNGKRIYISGDTEDILEMRQLKNIDMAFVCMNLPYTMTVDSAADAVLQFKPKKVYPYHYRGSDVEKFRRLVNNSNPSIEVVLLEWYPPSA